MTDPKIKMEALRLRNEEGLSYNEISRQLGLPCSTVKTWFLRAERTAYGDHYNAQGLEHFARKSLIVSNSFTVETQELLSANPYVKTVSHSQIRFTHAFREEYWRRYRNGQEPKDILNDLGIDPEILGESRINGLHKRIREAAESGLLFNGVEQGASVFADGMASAKALRQMRHELAYLRQEIEFIKKIMSMGEDQKL